MIEKFDNKEKEVWNLLDEVVNEPVDDVVNKVIKGDLVVDVGNQQSCKEVAVDWEVQNRQAAFQKALINLRNKGQSISQKEIKNKLDCLEKLIKCKEYSDIDTYQLGYSQEVVDECNNFLVTQEQEAPQEVLEVLRRKQNPVKKVSENPDQLKVADELIKKMKQERLYKKLKEKEKRALLKEKLQKQEQQFTKRQAEAEEDARKQRHEKLIKIREKEEMRKRRILENQNNYVTNLKKVPIPLYKKIEKQFEEDYTISELEKRKKELAVKRSFMKPIDPLEIANHEKEYEEKLRIEQAKRENKYKLDSDYDHKKYHSVFLDNVLDSDAKAKEAIFKKSRQSNELCTKKKNYSKVIMETYKPQISKRKKIEMELIKQNLIQPRAYDRITKKVSSTRNSDRSGLYKRNHSVEARSPRRNRKNDPDWRSMNRIVGPPKPEKSFVKIDYLKRSYRDKPDEHSEYKQNDWKSEIRKYDGEDRINYMKEKARTIEELALRKEKHLKLLDQDTNEERNEVNDMIIDSIKAKIALLDNID
ncbi:unnamed protein product [Moneuplotes crassus]|uniref:Uncharacterized protein n=1 Tax=Euplotes crassus TaxID=5936 RepID=A0AAD1TZ57_EUPCR|nr:unnamed protein product [Moneuplotes crassus]